MNKASIATERLKDILIKDKVKATPGFLDVFKSDLRHLLGDYFELDSDVYLELELTDKGDFYVIINTRANRIKTFMST